jgi:hypothetical protein
MRIYMVSTYHEYGPENIKCCSAPSEVSDLIRSYAGRDPYLLLDANDFDAEVAEARRLLANPDIEVNEAHGLSDGWGGFQLTILEPIMPHLEASAGTRSSPASAPSRAL